MEDERKKYNTATKKLADSSNKPDFDKILRQQQRAAQQSIAAAKELGAIRSAETQARVQQQTNAALALQATTGGRASTRGQAEEQRFGQFMASEIRKDDAQTQAQVAQANQAAINQAIQRYNVDAAQAGQNLRLSAQLDAPRVEQGRQMATEASLGMLAERAKEQGATNAQDASALLGGAIAPERLASYFPAPTQYEFKQLGDALYAVNPNDINDVKLVAGAQPQSTGGGGTSAGAGVSSQSMTPTSGFGMRATDGVNFAPVNSEAFATDYAQLTNRTGVTQRAAVEADVQRFQALGINDPVSATLLSRLDSNIDQAMPKTQTGAQAFEEIYNVAARAMADGKNLDSVSRSINIGAGRAYQTINDPSATSIKLKKAGVELYQGLVKNAGRQITINDGGSETTVANLYDQQKQFYNSMQDIVSSIKEYNANVEGKGNLKKFKETIAEKLIENTGLQIDLIEGRAKASQNSSQFMLDSLSQIAGIPSDRDLQTVADTLVTKMSTPQQVREFEQRMNQIAQRDVERLSSAMGIDPADLSFNPNRTVHSLINNGIGFGFVKDGSTFDLIMPTQSSTPFLSRDMEAPEPVIPAGGTQSSTPFLSRDMEAPEPVIPAGGTQPQTSGGFLEPTMEEINAILDF